DLIFEGAVIVDGSFLLIRRNPTAPNLFFDGSSSRGSRGGALARLLAAVYYLLSIIFFLVAIFCRGGWQFFAGGVAIFCHPIFFLKLKGKCDVSFGARVIARPLYISLLFQAF